MKKYLFVLLILAMSVSANHSNDTAYWGSNFNPSNSNQKLKVDLLGNQGIQAYSFNVYPDDIFLSFNLNDVNTIQQILNPTGFIFVGGDFVENDFSTMYLVDYYGGFFKIDTTSGAITYISETPDVDGVNQTFSGMTYNSYHQTLYVTSNSYDANSDTNTSYLYAIDPITGYMTLWNTVQGDNLIIDIAASPSGEMYGHEILNDNIVKVYNYTSYPTIVGSTGFDANFAQGMDFDDATGKLYLAAYNNVNSTGELREVNLTTGATTLLDTFNSEYDAFAIASPGDLIFKNGFGQQ